MNRQEDQIHKAIKVSTLHERLSCDYEAGTLVWKQARPIDFKNGPVNTAEATAAQWNKRMAGKPAFTALNKGYRVGNLQGRVIQAHRVVWAMYHGKWPAMEIDHINGNRADNRITNLRDCERAENAKNMSAWKGREGMVGVSEMKSGKYRAYIRPSRKQIHLGVFETIPEARAAVAVAREKYGFHENHGKPQYEGK